MSGGRFDPLPVLEGLKDFQRRTVDRVLQRLYLDESPGRRFLVADEVGLGKTLVARGVIARALEHLHGRVERIDIIYVCSNAAIAGQNVRRLNVLGDEHFALATRLTMLPVQVRELSGRSINFVSFTPGTSFDLKSRGGQMGERAVLCTLLEDQPWLSRRGLRRMLRNKVQEQRWLRRLRELEGEVDPQIRERFVALVTADGTLRDEIARLSEHFHDGRRRLTRELQQARLALIGALRHRLATVCIHALEPDLVILDEFQRFRELLHGDDEAATLARALFDYEDARVLLLSATPYKMLSLDDDAEEDHYSDFLRTLDFLLEDPARKTDVQAAIAGYRRALYGADSPAGREAVRTARDVLQRELRAVMCRTERVGMTRELDSMLTERCAATPPEPADLRQARVIDRVTRAVGAPEAIEYWKSAPYVLSYLRGYKVREQLDAAGESSQGEAAAAMAAARAALLDREALDGYARVDPGNARMRALFADTMDRDLWRLLWLPPSMPYSAPDGPYSVLGDVTKSLVFSAWSMVPDAIATLCSYEAERRMVASMATVERRDRLYEYLRPLLRFTHDADGRLTGMPALVRLYPSPSLASRVDPLRLALEAGGRLLSAETLIEQAEAALRADVVRMAARCRGDGRDDERWYWALPAMLDAEVSPGAAAWMASPAGWVCDMEKDEPGAGFRAHVAQLAEAADGRLDPPLGAPPADLAHVMAELAMGGPGVCALRALRRVAPEVRPDAAELLAAASHAAAGFRTLFNLPETIALLRGADPDTPYWRLALRYAIDGNLQALLDEQVHVLQESLGLIDATPETRLAQTAAALAGALSIRTSQVRVDDYLVTPGGGFTRHDHNVRCRFALRFGELRDDRDTALARAEDVRGAFNSPFRPFVLASTSIGQEGLDFHTWCHAVMHWNLPSNPVDLEQREGRVHRFKGHAVRKNVARAYGLQALARRGMRSADPWAAMFEMAAADRQEGTSELVPYWLFEIDGGAQVERRVPLMPYSREVEQFARLKRGVALYRLVFGQPRQEDLLGYLSRLLPRERAEEYVREWRIDLAP